MQRPEIKRRVFLAMAAELAKLSTCRRLQVGCILLRVDGSIAGGGYNGSLPGMPHCTPESCNPTSRCYNTRHAERSALDYSEGRDVFAAYVTHEPCLACTRDLAARGCKVIYYAEKYQSGQPAEVEAREAVVRFFSVTMIHVPSL
jgi:dCMP deaminase